MAKRKRDAADAPPKPKHWEMNGHRSPSEPRLPKDERKALARRLRDRLRVAPMGVADISEQLEIEPEVVVIALRELRGRKRGRLRSGIRLGHVSWWWEDEVEDPPKKPKKKK